MIVVFESVAFGFLPAALNVTKKSPPWSAAVGCQVSVPEVFPGAEGKTALLPGGSAERFATRELIEPQFVGATCTSTRTGARHLGPMIPAPKPRAGGRGEAAS